MPGSRWLVDDLEARLDEWNRQRLSDRAPWTLVQPSGIFPLVGPVFRPGQGACWTCLAERMKRNREVKALIDRRQARCVAVSPLAHETIGQSAIQLAAIEVAKAIAADFRTLLSDHIISLDLMGSTIVKHHGAARPQCPACGRKKLRDPRRAPAPIQLGAGGKVVMTSGGYRSVSPSTTVARFRRHVSPLTGVVSVSRADPGRFAPQHQLLRHAQFFRAGGDGSSAQGGLERRQLRQGQHGRTG